MTYSMNPRNMLYVWLVTWATNAIMGASSDADAAVFAEKVQRDINEGSNGFNLQERNAIVESHNHFRRLRQSSNMKLLKWDTKLEETAQKFAQQCTFDHTSNKYRENLAGYTYVGESVYAGSASFAPSYPVEYWHNEVRFYDYNSGECVRGKRCGHYTQIVWANSKTVGCGMKYCNDLKNAGFTSGYLVVCHYGPGGNVPEEKPYMLGGACSQCPSDAPVCVNGLCDTA